MQIIAGPIIFITFLFLAIFLLCVISIAAMVVSLSRQGDERRQMILTQASSQTLYITVALLILTNLEQIIRIFFRERPLPGHESVHLPGGDLPGLRRMPPSLQEEIW